MSQKYYSASTKGFYDDEVHGYGLPEDAIEITDEEHRALLEANSRGQILDTGKDGKPTARGLNDKELSVIRKRARDQMLNESDWLVNRHRDELEAVQGKIAEKTTLTDGQYVELQNWRASLRNMTEHPDFPRVQFPLRPEGI